MTKTKRKPACMTFIEFGDDFGDNVCTFWCQLNKDHEGMHENRGTLYGQSFCVQWSDPKPEQEKETD